VSRPPNSARHFSTAAATDFRQDVARGISPGQLAYEFRDVDAVWQRLARRTNRIARGRTGPNIQQVANMGTTLAQLHDALGLPGYAPIVTVGGGAVNVNAPGVSVSVPAATP